MWQIHNTLQHLANPSDQNQIGKTQNSTQSYGWKHGTVYLSTKQQLTDLRIVQNSSVVITTEPFYSTLNSDSQYLSIRPRIIFVQSGQQNKTLETVDYVCQNMLKLGVNRQSTVYILGGGMLLDLGGFVCAIYMRGVKKVVYIPTTLLALVDATVGGKSGINWSGAKNMLGVIRHPHQIRISMHYLDTLSDRQFSNGLAEVIKMSVTHDKQLFEIMESQNASLSKLRNNKQLLRSVVKKSLQIKMKVVQRDQFDQGQRNWLNFGHTVGHAIQLSKCGQKLMHGQCVSIGMLQQIKIGYENGQIKDISILTRIQNILKKYNLPIKIPQGTQSSQIIKLMTKDKKNKELSKVQLTLIQKIGERKLETSAIEIQKLYEHFTNQVMINFNKSRNLQRVEMTNINWKQNNKFPSSKSLSIRYLFLAALHYYKNKKSIMINNFLFADDSECIKQSLIALGFRIRYQTSQKVIQIYGYEPTTSGTFNVGNSGLTARFILPLCCHIEGQWTIQCHPRMSERPNKQIFKFCQEHYNIEVEYLSGKENSFPVKILSQGLKKQSLNKQIIINSQDSSQYLSSILLNSYIWMNKTQIVIPAEKLVSESYVKMTIGCLQYFGSVISHHREQNVRNVINVDNTVHKQLLQAITIEQDLSSFSYPFALSLIHSSKLPSLPLKSSQGDMKFYQYCHQLLNSSLPPHLQFSQCTDTFMTFAVILATNTNNRFNVKHEYIQISGISNQRIKQSNRIKLTRDNLAKIGYYLEQTEDGLIFPIQSHQYMYKQFKNKQNIIFQSAGDHRLAMSMAVLATYLSSHQKIAQADVRFIIDDKNAVNKTFPSFWHYLSDVGTKLNYKLQLGEQQVKVFDKAKLNQPKVKQRVEKVNKIVLLGNRGCGKTSIGKIISGVNNNCLIDIDEQITKQIKQKHPNHINSIEKFVQFYGWEQFRQMESLMIDKFVTSPYLDHLNNNSNSKQVSYIVSVGGGVVDHENSIRSIHKSNRKHLNLYIQKQFHDLQIQINENRPFINNFQQVYHIRSKKYEQIADYILTIPKFSNQQKSQNKYELINQYIKNEFSRIFGIIKGEINMNEGIVYCVPTIYENSQYGKTIDWTQQQQFLKQQILQNDLIQNDIMTGVQLRMDSILQHAICNGKKDKNNFDELIKQCRYSVADFKYTNNKIIKNIHLLLTLRTRNQFGMFPFETGNIRQQYHKWLNALHQIPAEYVDYQYKQLIQNRKIAGIKKFIHNFPKYMYSYHGSSIPTVNNLLSHKDEIEGNKSLIKLCYKGSNNMWDTYHKKWQQNADICINLQNPMTRLSSKNRYKMVIRQNDKSGVIKIPTRRQLRALGSLKKLFMRH